jgi:hypothetical protein
MKRIIAEPGWGNMLVEDDETGEVSFQCICGGIAMYSVRIVLNAEELSELREGTFDADRMVQEVCKKTARVRDRLVPGFTMAEVARSKSSP